MRTQRVNGYKVEEGTVYFAEELNPETGEWSVVGDSTRNLDHAMTMVQLFNLRELVLALEEK